MSVIAFLLAQFVIRSTLSSNLDLDEAELVGYTYWALGYPNSHPPLINWIVRISYELIGEWQIAIGLVKTLLLLTTYLMTYDIVRRSDGTRLAGAVAATAIILLPMMAASHITLVHSVLVTAAAVATFHAVVLVVERNRFINFVWLGVVTTIGLLSKYNFVISVVAMALSTATIPTLRHALWQPRLLVSAVILVLAVVPHAVWALSHFDLATKRISKLHKEGNSLSWIDVPGLGIDGVLSLILAAAGSLALLAIIWTITWRSARKDLPDDMAPPNEGYRLAVCQFAGRTITFGFGIWFVITLAGDLTTIHIRYLMPLTILVPIWLTLSFPLSRNRGVVLHYLATVAVFALISTLGWIGYGLVKTRILFPYDTVASTIRAIVNQPVAVLALTRDHRANLVIRLPEASIWDPVDPKDCVLLVNNVNPTGLSEKLGSKYHPGPVIDLSYPSRWQSAKIGRIVVEVWERNITAGAVGSGCYDPMPDFSPK